MSLVRPLALAVLAAGVLSACSTVELPPAKLSDGQLALPGDYKAWPKFLSAVQRPDAKQIREIYMNTPATRSKAGEPFAHGSVFVMENYAAQANADGTLKTGPDGKLVKGELLRVFVMGKNAGWGQDVPDEQRNGNWIYSSYLASGQKGPENTATCRACHSTLKDQPVDFVFRYDEHFASKRAALTPALQAVLARQADAHRGLASAH